ncbi:MAG: TetR/AcrR family transcriptional regulator [Alphaproteobacteria bacterium]|nr:TetR/AcrR family transcriptional regulator [Alphaproteobacteria bacterium]MCB9698721.1 TetR/AcrR family transcriptional regulator [Alphaproteobacteria bacterium]
MSEEIDGRVRRGLDAREARRAQILESSLQVFAERGFHATSVSDLVEAAGVARGTFYLYFDGKEALFLELLEDLTRHLRENIVGVDLTRGGMEDQLQATVERILATLVDNRALTRILFREAVGLNAAVDERLAAFDAELHGYVARALQVGQAVGIVRPLDAEVSAVLVVGGLREVVRRYVVGTDEMFDVSRVARAVLDHQLRGVLA